MFVLWETKKDMLRRSVLWLVPAVSSSSLLPAIGGNANNWSCRQCHNLNYGKWDSCRKCQSPKKSSPSTQAENYTGNWVCSGCRDLNFASRQNCRHCGMSRGKAMSVVKSTNPLDWTCSGCHYVNFAKNKVCKQCKGPSPQEQPTLTKPSSLHPGDWRCECGNFNLANRPECRTCGASKFSEGSHHVPTTNPLNWTCRCKEINFLKNKKCRNCGALQEVGAVVRAAITQYPGNWICKCSGVNFATDDRCTLCGVGRKRDVSSKLIKVNEQDWLCRCGEMNFMDRLQCRKCGEKKEFVGFALCASHHKRRTTVNMHQDANGEWRCTVHNPCGVLKKTFYSHESDLPDHKALCASHQVVRNKAQLVYDEDEGIWRCAGVRSGGKGECLMRVCVSHGKPRSISHMKLHTELGEWHCIDNLCTVKKRQ